MKCFRFFVEGLLTVLIVFAIVFGAAFGIAAGCQFALYVLFETTVF